ncbi:hypothetical protein [Xanthomonas campestris]
MNINFNFTNCFNGNTVSITKRVFRWTISIAVSFAVTLAALELNALL